jgi:glutathione synthase/RimK-type ligase-like ATP-grasp enzyme
MIIVKPQGNWVSAENLAEEINNLGCPCSCIKKEDINEVFINHIRRTNEPVIAWGVICDFATLNRIHHNKLEQLTKLKEEEVPVPEFFIRNRDVDCFPVIGRNLNHSEGRDIIFIENEIQLVNISSSFYVKFINKEAEYRVHVVRNKIISIIIKTGGVDNRICANRLGWTHTEYNQERYPRYSTILSDMAKRSIEVLGYDFGAVDIIRDRDNNFIVLEVNRAPEIQGARLREYANAFIEIMREC